MPTVPSLRPTQRDIAKALNVSQTSVAFALGAKYRGRISAETESLILAKAAEMHYRPNRLARAFRHKRSHTIAVVFASSSYQAVQDRIKFLAQSALKSGYRLLAVDLDWFGRDQKTVQEHVLDSTAEGVIFCNLPLEQGYPWKKFLEECPIPCVLLSSCLSETMNQAQADIRDAFRQMTRHHLQMGSRRPMLLLSSHDADYTGELGLSIRDRAEGFVTALRSMGGQVTAGSFFRERFVGLTDQHEPIEVGALRGTIVYPEKLAGVNNPFESGFYQVEKLRKQDNLPDSLICANDEIAAGALAACVRHQITVPNTLRISGADDAPFSRFAAVPLTTISQPSSLLAEWCIERITHLIETPGESKPACQKILPCQILLRQSTIGASADSPQSRRNLSCPSPETPNQPQIL